MVEDREAKPLPKKPLLRSPSPTPNPMIVCEDDPRVPGRTPTSDGLEEIEEPVDGPFHLLTLHEGVREGLLAGAPRSLAKALCQRKMELVRHARANWKSRVEDPPTEADLGRGGATAMKSLPHPIVSLLPLTSPLSQVVKGVVLDP